MDTILFAANSFSTTFYLVVGFFGYLHFGLGTDGNILLNYAPNDMVALVGR
jgi:amino acid permease